MGHFQNSNIRPASPIVFKSGAPVSVVCVAATYTGVTYANNGGKVQLTSAGVHGLTTSPAVGSSVYVSWTSGTGVSGLYNVNSVDNANKITIGYPYAVGLGTPTVAVATTAITTATFSIPALLPTSQIRAYARCSTVYTATSKELRILFGGQISANKQTASATIVLGVAALISNDGVTNSQTNNGINNLEVLNTGSGLVARNVNTAIAQNLSVVVVPGAANEPMVTRSILVEVFI